MVNTFILSNSPQKCVKFLDYKRLGKQRVEAKQIIDALEGSKSGWSNHPVSKMWKDDIIGLKYYYNCCVDEWISRGYKNTMVKYDVEFVDEKDILPWFYTNKQIQESFKASLLRKNPEYYEKMWSCDEDYMKNGYIWIHKLSKDQIEQMKKGIDLPLIDICEKFGSGTPAQYRISRELCQKWILRKHMNPETWRTIKESGTIYKDYEKASKFYGLI